MMLQFLATVGKISTLYSASSSLKSFSAEWRSDIVFLSFAMISAELEFLPNARCTPSTSERISWKVSSVFCADPEKLCLIPRVYVTAYSVLTSKVEKCSPNLVVPSVCKMVEPGVCKSSSPS